MKSKSRLTGILIFIALVLGTVYLSLFSAKEEKKVIEKIELSGNHFLSKQEYFNFARLNKLSDYRFLDLSIIKDRLEKHPYVLKADVRFINEDKVQVNITEKTFQAVLLTESDQYLMTENFMLVPYFSFTKNLDLPVIENPLISGKIKSFDILKTEETKAAFRLIEAVKMINPEIYSELSDIDLRYGKDIVLRFRGYNFQVVFGRGEEVQKLMSFEKVWDRISKNKESADSFINYVDLRYSKLIYIGVADLVSEVKGIKG
ncbi:MAG: cell division protein FtsQ/DivIB [Bacillota bacterium]